MFVKSRSSWVWWWCLPLIHLGINPSTREAEAGGSVSSRPIGSTQWGTISKEEKKSRSQGNSTSPVPALSASSGLCIHLPFVVPKGERDSCFKWVGQLHLGTRNSFKTPSQLHDGESIRNKQWKYFMRTVVWSWKNLAKCFAPFCIYVLREEGKYRKFLWIFHGQTWHLCIKR